MSARCQPKCWCGRLAGRPRLELADNGPGIPPGDADLVFVRFYRADKSRANPGGTGIGLEIVRHLVELLDRIVKASNLGGGALFCVELPAAALGEVGEIEL